ncbi:hypothetical protein SDC9_174423 [bioreactor metagenome]|uniref:Uncharacterized protein n=1 Tax=bioreactor metagenome TaxID=1076179 RepID=A0A645GLA0_9ZZZZ
MLAKHIGDDTLLVVWCDTTVDSDLLAHPGIASIGPYNQARAQHPTILEMQCRSIFSTGKGKRADWRKQCDVMLPPQAFPQLDVNQG